MRENVAKMVKMQSSQRRKQQCLYVRNAKEKYNKKKKKNVFNEKIV